MENKYCDLVELCKSFSFILDKDFADDLSRFYKNFLDGHYQVHSQYLRWGAKTEGFNLIILLVILTFFTCIKHTFLTDSRTKKHFVHTINVSYVSSKGSEDNLFFYAQSMVSEEFPAAMDRTASVNFTTHPQIYTMEVKINRRSFEQKFYFC